MLKTNVENLVKMKVQGEVIHPELWVESGYATTWDGRPKLTVGIGGIVHNVRVGDPVFGWVSDHLNAGVAVSDPDRAKQMALNTFSCIGNRVKTLTGEAKGALGVVVGKTYFFAGRSCRIVVHFESEHLQKLAIGDRVEVEAWGTGLGVEGFDDVRVINLSPDLFEAMGLEENGGRLVVPVVSVVPGYMMGTGVGRGSAEYGAWDIQSCSPDLNKELGLEGLRFGDLVAVTDVSCDYGNTVYEGGLIVGVVSHGASELGGHGPGLATIFTTKNKDRIEAAVDAGANVARYLGLRGDL